jgi:hypothetical protein
MITKMMDIYSRRMSKEITQAIMGGQAFAGDAMPRKGGLEAEMGGNPFDHMYSTLKETKNQIKSVSRKAVQLYQAVGRALGKISNRLRGQPNNTHKVTTPNAYNSSETNEPSNSFKPKSMKNAFKNGARKFSNTVKFLRGKPINVYKGTPVPTEANVNAPEPEQSTNQPRNANNERETDGKAPTDRANEAQKNSFLDELKNKSSNPQNSGDELHQKGEEARQASIDRAKEAQKNSFSDELNSKLAERRKKIDQQSDDTSNN